MGDIDRLAQLVEHGVYIARVAGSNPAAVTKFDILVCRQGSQVGHGGRLKNVRFRFDSEPCHPIAGVAQW